MVQGEFVTFANKINQYPKLFLYENNWKMDDVRHPDLRRGNGIKFMQQ